MMQKLFGTDGVRGTANIFPMTVDIALNLGKAAGKYFRNEHKKTKILIGKDTRISGYMIEYAITAGITSMGVDVLLVGPMPTPAIAHLTKSFAADAGIVISASHNPAKDNGIKFFDINGHKLTEDMEKEIESLALKNHFDTSEIIGKKIGKAKRIDDAAGRYIEFAKGTISNMSLKGKKIVLDCANGAAYKIAPMIFEELGAEVYVLNNTPDGLNINKDAGALYPEMIAQAVIETKSDIGIALDGDADRVILIDENGEIIDGDETIAIIAKERKEAKRLGDNNVVVTTVMSNLGFEKSLIEHGIELYRTPVGDKYVAQKMREINSYVGGEQSGHIILSKYMTTGDGIIAALHILRIMQKTNQSLSDLKQFVKKMPQVLLNFKVAKRVHLEELTETKKIIESFRDKLGDDGRILVRYSGTENKARVMVEGINQGEIDNIAKEISKVMKKELGE